MARLVIRLDSLKPRFDFIERRGIKQFAQVSVAEQFLQLRLINRERLGAALGQRSVAFVNVISDIGKEQRGGERRRLIGFNACDADLSPLNFAEDARDCGQIENITNTFAISFENNWERRKSGSYRQQIRGTFSLLP